MSRLLAILYGRASIDDLVEMEKQKKSVKSTKSVKVEQEMPDVPNEIQLLMSELMGEPQDAQDTQDTPSFFCYTCGSHEHNQVDCPESWRVIEHIDERMKEESSAVGEETPEVEEETIDEKNEDLLLSWTAHPSEEDQIVHAIPVCAPYAVVTDYRYHVKLTAGKMKKGAIAKVVVDHWLKEKMADNEKKAIKQLSNDDLVSVIMNNSKVIVGSTKGKK